MVKHLFLFLIGSLLIAGCGSKEVAMAPMGDSAPEFGKAAEHATLQGFMAGRWCLIAGISGPNPNFYYEFKPDGTFTCGETDSEWNAAGKWTVTGNQATLTYETMKGKPWQAFIEEYKKDEQAGGQVSVQRAVFYDQLIPQLNSMVALWVEDDKKHLTFSQPIPENAPPIEGEDESGSMGSLTSRAGGQLERMAPKKE